MKEKERETIQLLKQIIEPNLNNDLVSLGMIRNLRVVEDYIYLKLYLGSHQSDLKDKVQAALSPLEWCKKAYIEVCTIARVKITLAISSGKGGVGKSTTSVNLAMALSQSGAKVGLLDADVYGPNIPQMLGLKHSGVRASDTPHGQKFIPLEAHGIKVISVGSLVEPERPLAWRGPVLHKLITQFLNDVEWGELDYLLIDLPPGTGDAQITIVQESPICGVVMVTTPQKVALSDVRRGIYMFRQVGIPVLGIVENMSYLEDATGKRTPIFGSGGGEQIARELSAPLLGQIPLEPSICSGGDKGTPISVSQPDSLATRMFDRIALALGHTFKIPLNQTTKSLAKV
ncbi:Mrp/NBP35 family ATP-binding protein [Myxosarcina sp. GI1(2024)]